MALGEPVLMCKNGLNKNATIVKISNAIIGAGLTAVATGAAALSLGASHGTVVLGAPVDLVFDVQPDPGTDVASSCVRVRLQAGDTAVPDSKVQVTPVPAAAGRVPSVRVRAFITADEPIITATVSAGCSGGVSRRYIFLAQLPEAAASSASSRPLDVGQLAGLGAPAGSGLGGSSGTAVARGERAAAAPGTSTETAPAARSARRRPEGTTAAPVAATPPSRARRPAPAAPSSPAAERARLVMEPLDVWLDAPLPLRNSVELSPASAAAPASAEQRAEAAALWKALNTPVEDVQRAAARTAQLEGTVAAERARAASERAAAADLRQRLDSAESDSFPALVVYALLGLVVLLLALAAWLWARARREREAAWSQVVVNHGQPPLSEGAEPAATAAAADGAGADTRPQDADAPAVKPRRLPVLPRGGKAKTPPAAPGVATAPVPAPAGPALRRDDGLHLPAFADSLSSAVLVEGPAFTRNAPLQPTEAAALPPAPPPVPAAAPAFAPSGAAPHVPAAPVRAAGPLPEDLFDIQQQAEFFVSVGEHDQAIDVLQQHIAAHGDTSAFAYLELLRLYHTLGRVERFQQLREQFRTQFNVFVPEFGAFHRAGRSLQGFPDALAAIEAEWSSPAVVSTIEGLLFRQSDTLLATQFDLAAFDDLLLLLAIAQTTPASARGAPPPRQRTTPAEPPDDEVLAAQYPAPAPSLEPALEEELRSFDTLSGGLTWESLPAPLPPSAPAAPAASGPASASMSTVPLHLDLHSDPDAMLDLDLSDPPHLTLSDLPPLPVTEPPAPGQPVGFGMENDRMELRLELDELQRKRPIDP